MKARAIKEAADDVLTRMNFFILAFIVIVSVELANPLPEAFAPHCASPLSHRHAAERLRRLALAAVLSSFLTTYSVKILLFVVPGDGGRLGKATLRLLFLLALAFSAAGIGLAHAACFYTLQVSWGVPACWPFADRVAVYAPPVVLGVLCPCLYGMLAMDALASDSE